MNEVRKDEDEEEVLLKIKFQLPITLHAICVFLLVVNLFAIFVAAKKQMVLINYFVGSFIFIAVCYVIMLLIVNLNECVVTNKAIKGKQFIVFGLRTYKYRFDAIDSIDAVTLFGISNNIIIRFSQGTIFERVRRPKLVLQYVQDCDKVLKKLDNILTDVKNDKNTLTDLAMQHVQALSYIGESIQNSSISVKTKKETK